MCYSLLRRGLGLIVITCLSFILLACGGGGGGGKNKGNDDDQGSGGGSGWELSAAVCEELVPAVPHGLPTDPVALDGWPENDPAGLIVARANSTEGDGTWTVTLVRDFLDLPASVLVPLHPNGSPEGGSVTLTFGQIDAKGKEFWCQQEHDFNIDRLPTADNTKDASATLHAMRELGEDVAARYGLTLQNVRDMSPDDLPEYLYPLYFSAHLLGDDSDALQAQLNALPHAQRDVLDRLLTHINFSQYLNASTTELNDLGGLLDPADLTQTGFMLLAADAGTCTAVSVNRLSPMMSMSGWSEDALSGTSGMAMDAMATAAGVIGLIPHPAAQGVSRVGGALLFTVQTMLEGMSKLLPSNFTEADFRHIPHFFEEDSEDSGRWHSFHAQAASEGWRLDQAILEGVLVGVGTAGAKWGKWMESVVGRWDGLAKEFAQNLVDTVILDGVTGLVDAAGETKTSFVEVAPRCWIANDFDSSEKWTEVEFRDSIKGAVGDPHFSYEPAQAVPGTLVVRPDPSHFGGATRDVIKPVDVGPILITISPPLKMVEPGEIVDFTVTVRNALDTKVLIRDGLGFQLELDMDGDGSATFRYLVPDDRNELPLRITATSLSQGGLRGLPGAPERSGNALLQDEDIVLFVSPGYACLEPGDTEEFMAATLLGVDAGDVRWSAVGGSINQSGRFTAGNTGSATITATLLDRDNIQATARVNIMDDCDACRWRASVGGLTFGGASMSISPSTNPLYEQIILLTGPDSAEFTGATIQLDHSLALGSLNAPSVHQATIAPGPLSAWGAPYTLLDTDNITKLIEIPKPPLEIIRNEPGQDIYGQDQILIEGRLSGGMISVQLPLPQDGRMPATVEGNATLDFVGTFHISEISGGLMMTCSAGH